MIEFNFKASDVVKHSSAHILAAAVKRIFPGVKVGIGPVTKYGFYYDFEVDRDLTEEDLLLIEKNINQIIQENLQFERVIVPKAEGLNMLLQIGQIYKAELVNSIPEDQVSFYKLGDEFIDLCRGPHVKSANQTGIIKLTKIEETHWNDDQSRPKMYRVHGVVFQNIIEYNEYLESIKTIDSRNFLKFAIKNNLFVDSGNGYIITERGTSIHQRIQRFIFNEFDDLLPKNIYLGASLKTQEALEFLDKVYKTKNRSYKKIPIVFKTSAEDEYFAKESVKTKKALIYKIYSDSARSISSMGTLLEKILYITNYIAKGDINVEIRSTDIDHTLVKATSTVLQKKIISHNKILTNTRNSNIEIDFNTIDSVGKNWNFVNVIVEQNNDLKVYNAFGSQENIYSISVVFSLPTILAYLLEENGLDLPFEFNLQQIVCIPISSKQIEFIKSLEAHLLKNKFTCIADTRSKSFRAKIRDAEIKKSGFILVIGNKEELNNAVSVRHNGVEVGLVSIDNLLTFIQENKDKN
jgi:threonyl-tRNA synthetase